MIAVARGVNELDLEDGVVSNADAPGRKFGAPVRVEDVTVVGRRLVSTT
jgi:hypothetical protein